MVIAASDDTMMPGIGSGVGKLTAGVIGVQASHVERVEGLANPGDVVLSATGREHKHIRQPAGALPGPPNSERCGEY
jgi:class 3 adenylate cyclase